MFFSTSKISGAQFYPVTELRVVVSKTRNANVSLVNIVSQFLTCYQQI